MTIKELRDMQEGFRSGRYEGITATVIAICEIAIQLKILNERHASNSDRVE